MAFYDDDRRADFAESAAAQEKRIAARLAELKIARETRGEIAPVRGEIATLRGELNPLDAIAAREISEGLADFEA